MLCVYQSVCRIRASTICRTWLHIEDKTRVNRVSRVRRFRLSASSSWTVPQILCSCPEGRTSPPPPPPCGLFFSLLFFSSVFFFTIQICSSMQLSIMRWKLNALRILIWGFNVLYLSATSPSLTPLLIPPLSLSLSLSLFLSPLSLSLSLSLSSSLSIFLSPSPPLCLYLSLSVFLPLQSRHLSGIVGTYANSNIRCT